MQLRAKLIQIELKRLKHHETEHRVKLKLFVLKIKRVVNISVPKTKKNAVKFLIKPFADVESTKL